MSLVSNRVHLLVPALAVVAFGLLGCTSERTGGAVPGGSTSSGDATQTSPAAQSSSAAQGGDSRLASVDACSLLTDQEASQFKAQGPGKEEETQTTGGTSSCGWIGRSSDDSSTSFGIIVRADQGLDEINSTGGQLITGKVNSRPSKQFSSNIGAKCRISLGVSAKSMVDISFVIGAGTEPTEACETASQIANIVEPKLPKYEG